DNSLTAAMVVGIGADYAIYLIFRLREELKRHTDEADAVRATLRTAGKASLFVASAVTGGYAVLALSIGFYPHIWMAILICVPMLVSVFSTLILVPSLLLVPRPAFVFAQHPRRAPASAAAALAIAAAIGATAPTGRATAQVPASADGITGIMTKNFMVSRVA